MDIGGVTILLCRNGDDNDAAHSCSGSTTLFFLLQETKFCDKTLKNFAKFCVVEYTKFH
jgi:hypothetical protein